MAVIGCDIPVVVSGSECLACKAGVWTKTHLRQEGNYLVATTYLVAAGSPTVFEMRVDLRPLEKIAEKVHQALHAKLAGQPTAIGFSFSKAWKSIKKTAKKIGKTKLVKAVSSAVSAVTKNKVFQLAMPAAALGAHTTSRALGGKGVFEGPLGKVVDAGTAAVMTVVPGGAAARAVNPRTLAAFATAKAAVNAASAGKKLIQTATIAKNAINAGNRALGSVVTRVASRANAAPAAAAAALARAAPTTKAKILTSLPAVRKAAEIRARLNAPNVKATLAKIKANAEIAKKALQKTAYDARYATGSKQADAKKSAAIVNLVARNDARIAAIAQKNAGGLPGILIDSSGKVSRGRFTVRSMSANPSAPLLYTAPGQVQRGSFTRVAGPGHPTFMIGQSSIGQGPSRISNDIIGTCFQMQNTRRGVKNLRISGSAPGLIGCDCGSEF